MSRRLYTLLCGICMGAADIVPGISGGTIAFIMGFYSDLLESIKSVNAETFKSLFKLQFDKFKSTAVWQFLFPLISGMALAFIILAPFFDYILGHETYRVWLYSAFIGLILASVIFCAKQIERWFWRHYFMLAAGAVLAFILTGTSLKPFVEENTFDVPVTIKVQKPVENYDAYAGLLLNVPESTVAAMMAKGIISKETIVYSQMRKGGGLAGVLVSIEHNVKFIDPWILSCGAIAISAMLLPGISGSYLLSILGAYAVVIGALADFINSIKAFSFDIDAFGILTSMMLGIMIGALAFSRVVSWLLKNYRSLTIAMLTGFMIGALRSVWPFWSYSYMLNPLKLEKGPLLQVVAPIAPDVSSTLFMVSLLFAAVGFCSVFAIEHFAKGKGPVKSTVEI